MRQIVLTLLLSLSLSPAALITGAITNRFGQPVSVALSFIATNRPSVVAGGGVQPGWTVKTNSSTNGAFAVPLVAGPYIVQPGTDIQDMFTISVPTGTGIFSIDSVIASVGSNFVPVGLFASKSDLTNWVSSSTNGLISAQKATNLVNAARASLNWPTNRICDRFFWMLVATGANVAESGSPIINGYSRVGNASTPATLTTLADVIYGTGAVSGNQAYCDSVTPIVAPLQNTFYRTRIALTNTTSVRFWTGLFSGGNALLNQMQSNNALSYAAFRLSTNFVNPGNWWFCTSSSNSATVEERDTGVAATTAITVMDMNWTADTTCVASINGVPVATNNVVMPAVPLRYQLSINTLTNEARAVRNYFVIGEQNYR